MSDLVTGDFNYASVDQDTAEKLEYFAKSGKALLRKTQIQFVADMGKILSDARDLLASHNKNKGKFIKWATAEFDIEAKTVYRYVNAWDRMLCHDVTTYINWTQTAVYLASAEELPKPVQKKLAAMASKDMVRESDVKRVIEASKPKPVPELEVDEQDESDAEIESPSDSQSDVLTDDGEPDADQVEDDPAPVSQASIMLDSLGKQIPKNLRSASELAIQLNATGRELDKFRQIAKDYAEQPGGEWLRVQDIDDGVRTLKNHFQGARYHTVCQQCSGNGCKKCDQAGWLPDYLKGTV